MNPFEFIFVASIFYGRPGSNSLLLWATSRGESIELLGGEQRQGPLREVANDTEEAYRQRVQWWGG